MGSDIALILISYLNETEQRVNIQHQELVVQPFRIAHIVFILFLSYHELTLVSFPTARSIVGIDQSRFRAG
jgi:hypothetical protein